MTNIDWGDLKVVEVQFPASQWEENDALDDPGACLHGPILIVNGLRMHLEAWAVTVDEQGMQEASEEYAEDFEKLYEAVHASGSFDTLKIRDRDYIVVAHPMC